MAHNLFRDRMAWADDPPWHGLGKKVPANVSAGDMIKAAGLDWPVSKELAPGQRCTVKQRFLVTRPPLDGESGPVALGLVGGEYVPLQNAEAFEFFDPFIRAGWATFHTAGALGDGECIWVLTKLPGRFSIGKDDPVDRYLLLSNSHDGSRAVSVRFTAIRVVCENTLNLASTGGKAIVSIPHRRYMREALHEVQLQKLRLVSEKVFRASQRTFSRMAKRRITAAEIDEYLERLFPKTEGQAGSGTEPIRWVRVKHLFELHERNDSAGTLWALYNAVTRDEDYRISPGAGSGESRLNRIWFGRGSSLKRHALRAARALLN